jgi:hypothetical protein
MSLDACELILYLTEAVSILRLGYGANRGSSSYTTSMRSGTDLTRGSYTCTKAGPDADPILGAKTLSEMSIGR